MEKNKKILIAVGIVLLIAFVGRGDSNNSTANPTPTKTVTVTVTQEPPATDVIPQTDAPLGSPLEMVAMIQSQDPYFLGVSDAEVVDVANTICSTLRGGASIQDVQGAAEGNVGFSHVNTLIAGSILYLCPDMKYLVPNY